MEIFKSGLKSVLGAPQDAHQPTGAETVERLVDRVVTSTLLEDRRDACRALKALSKKFRLEVGAQALDALTQILQNDRADSEITGYALEAICNVISGSPDEEDENGMAAKVDENLGFQFTEIFIKKAENVSLLLTLMEEYDFKVRWPVVKLLTALLVHKPKELQECILVSPMGVSKLMDLLLDTREIIRNDTLLLLAHLTKGNANIQKIVAFEMAFDRLLSIIREEGFSDGGVIVEDCLLVLQTLLKNNSSNQSFFKEGSYIQHLAPFFELSEGSERGWSSQKVTNIHMMLQVLRVLVSPNNPHQVTMSSQKVMYQCGLLEQLCGILMASGVPADILTETINTVAEMLRGNHGNQEYFSTVTAPTSPPRPAIVVLLMSMINEKQPFSLRCSVLYCLQCFLYRNELGQAQIIQTLLPQSTSDVLTMTVGQMLCGGLFSTDSLSNWFAAVALSHCLVENATQKEQLLRVQLATCVGNPAVSLINQCCMMLQQGGKLQTKLGLLMLLCTWLSHCPNAVMQFLSIATNIPFLTSQVSLAEHDENEDLVQGMCAFLLGICIEFNDNSQQSGEPNSSKEDLSQLIIKRIGMETFLSKLGAISKNENYSRSAQNPYLKFKQPSDVLFDYEFCKLFKSLEGTIIKASQPKPVLLNGPESMMTPAQQELLQQYKDLIREQYNEISHVFTWLWFNYPMLVYPTTQLLNTITGAKWYISQTVPWTKYTEEPKKVTHLHVISMGEDTQLHDLRNRFSELTVECEKSKVLLEDMTNAVQQLKDQNALLKAQKAVSGSNGHPSQEVSQLRDELDEVKKKYNSKQKELEDVNNELRQVREIAQSSSSAKSEDQADSQNSKLSHMVQQQADEIKVLKEKLQSFEANQNVLEDQRDKIKMLEKRMEDVQKEKEEVENEYNIVQKEQEDMLVLLTEQSDKITEYKKRLRALGEHVEDDDDFIDEEDSDGLEDELNNLKNELQDAQKHEPIS